MPCFDAFAVVQDLKVKDVFRLPDWIRFRRFPLGFLTSDAHQCVSWQGSGVGFVQQAFQSWVSFNENTYAERHNFSIRIGIRRMTRLTNAHSNRIIPALL